MRTPFHAALFVFAACVAPIAVAAEEKTSPAAKTSLAGSFAGTWQGSGESGGKLQMKLKPDGAGWTAEASFTFNDVVIPTTLKSIKVDGAKVILAFTWAIENDAGESTMTGELTGNKLAGSYESRTASGPTQGTWSVTRTVEESKK
jgi:hypothetical protein